MTPEQEKQVLDYIKQLMAQGYTRAEIISLRDKYIEELKKKDESQPSVEESTEPQEQPTTPSAKPTPKAPLPSTSNELLYTGALGGLKRNEPIAGVGKPLKQKQEPIDVTYTPEEMPSETTERAMPQGVRQFSQRAKEAEKQISKGQLPTDPQFVNDGTISKVEENRKKLGLSTLDESFESAAKQRKEAEKFDKYEYDSRDINSLEKIFGKSKDEVVYNLENLKFTPEWGPLYNKYTKGLETIVPGWDPESGLGGIASSGLRSKAKDFIYQNYLNDYNILKNDVDSQGIKIKNDISTKISDYFAKNDPSQYMKDAETLSFTRTGPSPLSGAISSVKTGEKVVDMDKVNKLAEEMMSKSGQSTDFGYVRDLIIDAIKTDVNQEIIKPEAEKLLKGERAWATSQPLKEIITSPSFIYNEAKKEYQEATGKAWDENKQNVDITAKTRLKLDSEYKNIEQSAKAEQDALLKEYERLVELAKQQGTEAPNPDIINEKIAQINTKYEQRWQRSQDAILEKANIELEAAYKKFTEGLNIDPSIQQKFEKAYSLAYSEAAKNRDNRLDVAVADKGLPMAQFARTYMTALGGSLKGYGAAYDNQTLKDFGNALEQNFYLAPAEIDGWNSLLEGEGILGNFQKLSGMLAGSMTTGLAASTLAAATTGGTGVLPVISASIAGFLTESAEMAGRAKQEMFLKTGSISRANKAYEDTWRAQYNIAGLYAFEGLPFIGKAISGIGSKGLRIGLGAGVEYVTEVPQEFTQGIYEENIAAGLDPWDSFYEKTNPFGDSEAAKIARKRHEENLITLTPTLIMGGAGQIRSTSEKTDAINAYAAMTAKEDMASQLPDLKSQWLQNLYQSKGGKFTSGVLASMHQAGQITTEQFGELNIELERVKNTIETARENGITKKGDVNLFSFLSRQSKTARQNAEKYANSNPGLSKFWEEKAKEYDQQSADFLNGKTPNVFTVTFADGSQSILSEYEAKMMAKSDSFLGALENGSARIESYRNDQKEFMDGLRSSVDSRRQNISNLTQGIVSEVGVSDASKVEKMVMSHPNYNSMTPGQKASLSFKLKELATLVEQAKSEPKAGQEQNIERVKKELADILDYKKTPKSQKETIAQANKFDRELYVLNEKKNKFFSPRISQLMNENKMSRADAAAQAETEWRQTEDGKRELVLQEERKKLDAVARGYVLQDPSSIPLEITTPETTEKTKEKTELPLDTEAPTSGTILPNIGALLPGANVVEPESIEERRKIVETEGNPALTGLGEFSVSVGGSNSASVPVGRTMSEGKIETIQYANPQSGNIDLIISSTPSQDYVAYIRVYDKDGNPTNQWTSKMESREGAGFSDVISEAKKVLPEGHEWTEKTSVSTDGLRVFGRGLERGYELQYDENGNVVTNRVMVNVGARSSEEMINAGVPVTDQDKKGMEPAKVGENDEQTKQNVTAILTPYLKKMGLNESNIYFEDGKVYIDLPVLKQSKKVTNDQKDQTGLPSQVGEGKKPIETQPIQGAGAETTEASGVLQAPGQEEVEVKLAELPTTTIEAEVVEEKPTSETEGETTVTVGGTAAEKMRQRRSKRKGAPVAETQEKPKEEKPKEEKPATGETKVSEVAPAVRPARAVEASEGSNPEAGEDSALEAAGMTREERDEWKKNNKAQGKKPKIEQLTQAVKDLVSGKKSFKDYYRMAKELMPSKLMDKVPTAATFKEIIGAIDSNKLKIGIVGLNKFVKKGMRVGLRIDIPSFNNHGKNVVTVHDRSKSGQEVIGYGSTGSIKNVNFRTSVPTAAKIGTGETSKSAFAMAEGEWMDESPESIQKRAEEAMNSPEWVQVSMNPARNSFFFDKADGNPVVSADEVLQVGNLVLAKNPKKIDLNTAEGMAEFERMFSTTDKKTGVTYQYRTAEKTIPGEVKTGRKFTGRAAVNRVVDFLKKANIDVELVSDDRFKEVQKGTALTGSLDGLFFTDEKSGKIYLRESKVDTHFGDILAFHEGIHPVMNIVAKTNPKLYDAIHDGLQNLAKENSETGREIRRVIETQKRFAEENGWDPSTLKDEIIVEALAIIAAKGLSIPQSQRGLRNAIIDFLNKIAKILNIPTKSRNVTDADFRAFVKKLSNAIREGGDIGNIFSKKDISISNFENLEAQGRISAEEVLSQSDRGDKKVIEVAKAFEKAVDVILSPSSPSEERVQRFLINAYHDLRYFFNDYKGDTGLDWYTNKVKEFDAKLRDLSNIAIENGEMLESNSLSDPENMDLFRVVLALSSIGINPRENVKSAFSIWKTYNRETGQFEKYQPGLVSVRTKLRDKKGKYFAPSGSIIKETKNAYDIKQKNGKIIRVNKSDLIPGYNVTYQEVNSKGKKEEKTKELKLIKKSSANYIFKMGEGVLKIPIEDVLNMEQLDNGLVGKGWTVKGNVVAINLERIESLIADQGGVKNAINWLNSKQTISELRKYNEGLPDVNGSKGKKNPVGERFGSYIIGEKLGAFHQNVAGTPSELTMDLWWSRTWNRYMGTLITLDEKGNPDIQETPRTDAERAVMREAAQIAANSLGLEVHELQAALWYLEQQMYKRMGAAVESYSFVDGVNQLLLQYGKSEKEIQPERYGIDSSEADKRRADAAARAANIIYESGGKTSEEKNVTQQTEKKATPSAKGSVSQEREMEPSLVDEAGLTKNMTEDGNGNYVFYHKTNKPLKTIDPKFFGKTLATSRDERPGVGISMYYTRPDAGESMVGSGYSYIVRVPKDKVYPINEDPLNLYDEAKRMFEKDYPGQAFDANKQVGYITKLAGQKGFPMTVTKWQKGTLALRAQTTTAMKPEVHYTRVPGSTNAIEINEEVDAIEPNEVKMRREKRRAKGSASYEREMEPSLVDETKFSDNSIETIDRVKSATGEDGATINLDGTEYNGGGLVVPAGSRNVSQSNVSASGLYKFLQDNLNKISSDIFKIGLYRFPDRPEVSYDLNIVIPSKYREIGIEFGRLAGQESLFDLDTYENVKTGATGENPIEFTAEELAEVAIALSQGKMPNIPQKGITGTAKASAAQQRSMDPELAYNEVDRMIEDGENSGMNGQQMYDSISKTEAYGSLSPEDRSLVNDTLRSMGAVTSDPAASSIMSYDAGEKAAVLDALRDNKDLAYIYRNFREILTDLKEKGIIETDCI